MLLPKSHCKENSCFVRVPERASNAATATKPLKKGSLCSKIAQVDWPEGPIRVPLCNESSEVRSGMDFAT